MTTLKIGYVEEDVRANWKSLEDVKVDFTEEEIVEMVNRYQDTQKHAIAYRKRAQVRTRLMKARLAELEAKLTAEGGEESESEESGEGVGA